MHVPQMRCQTPRQNGMDRSGQAAQVLPDLQALLVLDQRCRALQCEFGLGAALTLCRGPSRLHPHGSGLFFVAGARASHAVLGRRLSIESMPVAHRSVRCRDKTMHRSPPRCHPPPGASTSGGGFQSKPTKPSKPYRARIDFTRRDGAKPRRFAKFHAIGLYFV
jgi:hypothetical protein